MKNILSICYIITLFFAFSINKVSGQGADALCAGASPFCTGTTYNFPLNYDPSNPGAGNGPQGQSGPDYGCLSSTPNPVWYFLKILDPGNITIHIASPTGQDVDFAAWGPFTGATSACTAQLTNNCTSCPNNTTNTSFYPSGNMVDCSYDPAPSEDCHISNALTGQYYMLCITNFSNAQTNVVFSQTNIGQPNDGTTDCAIMSPCAIQTATAVPSACLPGPNTYSVSGTASFINAPALGALIITDQQTGISQTITAPFTSPINYNLAGLISDGVTHTVHFAFTADQFCIYNASYTAPAACNSCSAEAGQPQTVCGLTATMAAVIQTGDQNLAWSYTGSVAGIVTNNPNSPNAIVTVPTPGTYTFTWTITNQFGITCKDSVMVKFANIPTSTFSAPNPSCFGDSVHIVYTGNASPTSLFTWNYGGGIGTTTGIGPHNVFYGTPGNKTIQLSIDESGCLSTITTNSVNVPPQLQFYVNVTPAACSNNTGLVSTVTSGGTPGNPVGYTYEWNTAGNSTPPLNGGNHTATVTDGNGCKHDTAFIVTQPSAIVATSTFTNLNCFADNSGTASISVSGGTPPYSYIWPNSLPNSPSQSNIAAGPYTVTINDNNLCQIIQNFTITQPPIVNASIINQTAVKCFGGSDGTLTASAVGGTFPLGFMLTSLPQATGTFSGLSAGLHLVTVIDSHGCTDTVSTTITEPTVLSVSITSQNNISCFGGVNGAATVTASGGTPSYQYNWGTGGVMPTIGNLGAGSQGVTVTDFNGCVDTAIVILTQPTVLQALLVSQTDVTCYGLCNGQAQVSPTGGTPPYTWYWWSGPQGNQSNVTILCSGTHSVTLTDDHNCTTTTSVTISQPTQVNAVISNKVNVSCYSLLDGQATVTASGGIPGYSYQWSAGGSVATDINSGLAAGPYKVTVTDSNFCTDTVSTIITQPTQLNASAVVSTNYNGYSISCNGLSNANITLTPSGGTTPWSYVWNNTATTQNLNGVAAGTYSVIVTDGNGCTKSTSATATQPLVLVVNVDSISSANGFGISCYGGNDGIIRLAVTGGTPSYSYEWTGGDTSQDLINASVGQYFVTVTDANGCLAYTDTVLNEPPALATSYIAVPVDCYGNTTGSIDLTVEGGVPLYSYTWSNTKLTEDITLLAAGTYFVTVKDMNNCLIYDTVLITQLPQLLITVSNDLLICSGDPTVLTVTATGGTGIGTYQYMWDGIPGIQNYSVNPTQNTTYSTYVKDANGCISDTGHIIVNILPPIILDAYSDRDSVCQGSPVYISATATGGDGAYTYSYNGNVVTNFPMQLYPAISQNFEFTVTDNTCISYFALDTVYVTVLPQPFVQFKADTVHGCQPLTVHFQELQNELGDTYLWEFNDEATTSIQHNPIHTFESFGMYDITLNITSKYGCQSSSTRPNMITVYAKPEARFNYSPDMISIIQPEVQFLNLSQSATVSFWYFGDGDSIVSANTETWNPRHVFHQPGEYSVKLIAVSNRGCRDTVKAPIIINNEYTLFAPNAISPDGDGINDKFRVYGHGIDEENFKLTISDRWGQLLFETRNQNEEWNGKHMNVDPIVPSGVYVWMVSWQDLGHVMHQKAGWVTVIN